MLKSFRSRGKPLHVLTSFPESALTRLQDACPDIRIVCIPEKGRLPFRVRGEVLLIPPWDSGNLAKVLKRGVRWVHTFGTGVERLPLDLMGERILTCSRGASGIPIAEWAFAVMLAFEKKPARELDQRASAHVEWGRSGWALWPDPGPGRAWWDRTGGGASWPGLWDAGSGFTALRRAESGGRCGVCGECL